MVPAVDLETRYRLAPDLTVVRRDERTIQIGTNAPRRVLISDAPPHADAVLAGLGTVGNLADAIGALGGDARWSAVFADLALRGLIEPARRTPRCAPRLVGEHLALVHRHGSDGADRILTSRTDAVVVIEGTGLAADLIAAIVDAAGVGRVHRVTGCGTAPAARTTSSRRDGLAARVARSALYGEQVHFGPPAPQVQPTVTVLAGLDDVAPGRIATLVACALPHLPVDVGTARAVIGPLVVPGRTTCTHCVERHRLAADPGWRPASTPQADAPALLTHRAAVAAASQVLAFVDGEGRPATIGASIELSGESLTPHLRRWPMHPDCPCRHVAARFGADLAGSTLPLRPPER